MNVTITGADDEVDPRDLLMLSDQYPFVEWGILFSQTRNGTPRYPSDGWLRWLQSEIYRKAGTHDAAHLAVKNGRWRFAAHACGEFSRRAQAGELLFPWYCRRVQINGYKPPIDGLKRLPRLETEVILQCRSIDTMAATIRAARDLGRASVLFDVSGGRGVSPETWPAVPGDALVGFAGGIGPDNVIDALDAAAGCGASWIDMESGVRTEDTFDLGKVRAVLETVDEDCECDACEYERAKAEDDAEHDAISAEEDEDDDEADHA